MRAWVGLLLLLGGMGLAFLHFQAPEEPAAIDRIVLAYQDDRAPAGASAVRGAGNFASQKLSRGAGDLATSAPWERGTVVVGSVHSPSGVAASEQPSGAELARALQTELRRVGCYHGAVDGDWGPLSQQAMSGFTSQAGVSAPTREPDGTLLHILQGYTGQACGSCPAGEGSDRTGRCATTVLASSIPTETGSTEPVQRPEPLPGRMAAGAPTDDIGAYVPITREAASNTEQSSEPRVVRRPRVVEQSASRSYARPRPSRSWAESFFERIERR